MNSVHAALAVFTNTLTRQPSRCWQGTSCSPTYRESTDAHRTQSTLARELSAILNVPCILLDTIFWRPGWQRCPADEFRAAVRAALDQSPRGWVVDGNYTSKIGTMVTDAATDVICEPYVSW